MNQFLGEFVIVKQKQPNNSQWAWHRHLLTFDHMDHTIPQLLDTQFLMTSAEAIDVDDDKPSGHQGLCVEQAED